MAEEEEEGVGSYRRAPSSSLPPPRPKSPPMYPDLYGKRRETARLQMLDREIILLQEDLKFVQGLQPASAYCKEVVDFVVAAAADPLTPRKKKDRKSCRAWKWMCNLPCFNIQWLCCCSHCSFSLPKCCRSCKSSCNCTLPECDNGYSCCFQKSSCSTNCCNFACPTSSSSSLSCLHSLFTDWSCHMPKCAPWSCCCCCYHCKCINKCCNPCYSCCCM